MRQHLVFCLLLSLLFSFASQVVLAKPLIVENGLPQAVIITAPNPPRTVKLAATELQTYVRKLSGATLPIIHEQPADDTICIYLGKSSHTDALGLSNEGLRHGAYRIASGDRWVAMLGGDRDTVLPGPWPRDRNQIDDYLKKWDEITGEHFFTPFVAAWRKIDQTEGGTGLREADIDYAGTFNAVNHFLQDQGIRWYMPGDIGEIVPKRKSIALPQVNKVVKPDFAIRQLYVHGHNFYSGNRDKIMWQLRIGANQGDDILGFGTNIGIAHGVSNVIKREETKAAHPEFYAHKDGKPILHSLLDKPGPGVPCLASQALVDANVRYLQAMYDTYDLPSVSVSPPDGFTFLCECHNAQAFASPERGWYGAMSNYSWDYVQRVAHGIARTHPDRLIHGLAYSTYQAPPTNIEKLPSNVVMGIAQSRRFFHDRATRERVVGYRKKWQEKVTSGLPFYQYEYYLHGWRDGPMKGIPFYHHDLIAEDLRSLKGISMGEFTEVHPIPANLFNAYVTSQLYWDVNKDVDAIVDEFVKLFYGPAAEQMHQFISLAMTDPKEVAESKQKIDALFAAITAAKEKAGDTIYGQRIDLIIEKMQPMHKRKADLNIVRQNIKTLQADVVEESIAVDGKLDEPFWKRLPAKKLAGTESPASVSSMVQLGWRDGALIIGIRCDEPLMKEVNIGHTQDGDVNWFHYDGVEVMIETPVYSYYQIGISPVGAVTDLGRQGGLELAWSCEAEVAGHVGEDFYSIEIRLPAAGADRHELEPLLGVAGDKPTTEAPWFINVGRLRLVAGDREVISLTGKGFHDKLNFYQLIVPED